MRLLVSEQWFQSKQTFREINSLFFIQNFPQLLLFSATFLLKTRYGPRGFPQLTLHSCTVNSLRWLGQFCTAKASISGLGVGGSSQICYGASFSMKIAWNDHREQRTKRKFDLLKKKGCATSTSSLFLVKESCVQDTAEWQQSNRAEKTDCKPIVNINTPKSVAFRTVPFCSLVQ